MAVPVHLCRTSSTVNFDIMKIPTILLTVPLAGLAAAQLIGPVGPTTALSEKTHECSVLDYGGVADNSTDIADALENTFEQCVLSNPGSRLIVPHGNYLLNRSVVLSNATNWAFQLEGLITLAYGGNYQVDRELILQGYAGVQPLNDTINGEGDHNFLANGLVIVNGKFDTTLFGVGRTDSCSRRFRVLLRHWFWCFPGPGISVPQRQQVSY